jgi:hypothetical protein
LVSQKVQFVPFLSISGLIEKYWTYSINLGRIFSEIRWVRLFSINVCNNILGLARYGVVPIFPLGLLQKSRTQIRLKCITISLLLELKPEVAQLDELHYNRFNRYKFIEQRQKYRERQTKSSTGALAFFQTPRDLLPFKRVNIEPQVGILLKIIQF